LSNSGLPTPQDWRVDCIRCAPHTAAMNNYLFTL